METRAALVYLSALLAPLGALVEIPFLGLSTSFVALTALIVAAITDVVWGARPRVPFDLAWPPVLGLLVMPLAWPDSVAVAPALTLAALVFLATLHLASARTVILRALWLYCLASGVSSLLELLGMAEHGFAAGSLPMAMDPELGVVCFFQTSARAAVTQNTLALALAIALLFARELAPRRRSSLVLAAAPMALWLTRALVTMLSAGGGMRVAGLPANSGELAIALPVLWLAARVLARLVVGRMEDRPGSHLGLMAVLGLSLPLALLLGPRPTLPVVVLLSLIGAYARPLETRDMSGPRRSLLLGIAVATTTLVFLQVYCYPAWSAPRNLVRAETRLAALRAEGMTPASEHLLDIAARHNEAAAWFWRGEMSLARNVPVRAAEEFARSLRATPGGGAATLFGEDRMDTFLDRLRDVCSAVDLRDRGVAYERALLARGKQDLALASLKLFATERRDAGLPKEPIVEALTMLLGGSGVRGVLAAWDAGTLQGVLEGLGANVIHTGPGTPVTVLTAFSLGQEVLIRGYTMAGGFGAWIEATESGAPAPMGAWRGRDGTIALTGASDRTMATVRLGSGPEVMIDPSLGAFRPTPGLSLALCVP